MSSIVNASSGVFGSIIAGPKHFLNQDIRIGEIALCLGIDKDKPSNYMWFIGGIEEASDFISIAKNEGELDDSSCDVLSDQIEKELGKKTQPPVIRLANLLGVEMGELLEMMRLAQVSITDPIIGVSNFSSSNPKWLPRTVKLNNTDPNQK